MFCPRCGREGQAENSYCKRCGPRTRGGRSKAWHDGLTTKKGIYFFGGPVAVYCILLAFFQLLTFAMGRACGNVYGGRRARAVTERTTELLEPVPARRPGDGEPR